MTKIKISIKREDKRVFKEMIDALMEVRKQPETLTQAMFCETAHEIRDKLKQSAENDKSISLNLLEIDAFNHLLRAYEQLGDYEFANAIVLKERIREKLYKLGIEI
jgi:hypothetical protein